LSRKHTINSIMKCSRSTFAKGSYKDVQGDLSLELHKRTWDHKKLYYPHYPIIYTISYTFGTPKAPRSRASSWSPSTFLWQKPMGYIAFEHMFVTVMLKKCSH